MSIVRTYLFVTTLQRFLQNRRTDIWNVTLRHFYQNRRTDIWNECDKLHNFLVLSPTNTTLERGGGCICLWLRYNVSSKTEELTFDKCYATTFRRTDIWNECDKLHNFLVLSPTNTTLERGGGCINILYGFMLHDFSYNHRFYWFLVYIRNILPAYIVSTKW